MGFSQVGAFVIIASAGLLYAGLMLGSSFDAQQEWHDAWLEAEDRVGARRHVQMTLVSGVYDDSPPPGTEILTLTLDNDGSVTLSVSRLTYLVETFYYGPPLVESTAVDGITTTDVWPPGATLVVVLDVTDNFPRGGADPDFAVVTNEFGTQAFWRA